MSSEEILFWKSHKQADPVILPAPWSQELLTPLGAPRSLLAVTCPAITTFVPVNAFPFFFLWLSSCPEVLIITLSKASLSSVKPDWHAERM